VADAVVRALESQGVHPSANQPPVECAVVQPSVLVESAVVQQPVQLLPSDIFARVCREEEQQGPDGAARLAAGCGGIDGLVALLRDARAPDAAKQQAAWALRNLAYGDDETLERVADAGAIPPLVATLLPDSGASDATKQQAMWALCRFVMDFTQRVVDAGAIPALVALRPCSDVFDETKGLAARALRCLVIDQEDVVAQLVTQLVALLKPGSGASNATKQQAAGELYYLAYDKFVWGFEDAGAVPALAALLQPGAGVSDATKEYAAGALQHLAELANDADIKLRVADAGTLTVLVALLEPDAGVSDPTKERAWGVLLALAKGDDNLQFRVADLLPELIALLVPGACACDATNEKVAELIHNLAAGGNGSVKQRVDDAGALPALVALLEAGAGASGAKKQAAGAIHDLAAGDDGFMQRVADAASGDALMQLVVDAGAFAPLVALLKPGSGVSDATKRKVMGVLHGLAAENDAGMSRIMSAGIAPVVTLLQPDAGESDATKQQAAGLLMNLARYDLRCAPGRCELTGRTNSRIVADNGAIPPLVALLQPDSCASDATKGNAVGALGNLAKDDDALKQSIADAGAIPPLVALLQPGSGASDGTKGRAVVALLNLANDNKDLLQRIADAGALALLVALLQPGSGVSDATSEQASALLSRLEWHGLVARHDALLSRFISAGIKPAPGYLYGGE
jgi:hypothetical protein